jgi:hypothetical protein
MRFDTPIYFQRTTSQYNASTGNYDKSDPTEEMRYASVTNTGDETLRLVYGELRQGALTIRLQMAYTKPFDCIRIGEKSYKVDKVRNLRTKQTFLVSEVQ